MNFQLFYLQIHEENEKRIKIKQGTEMMQVCRHLRWSYDACLKSRNTNTLFVIHFSCFFFTSETRMADVYLQHCLGKRGVTVLF